MNSTKPEKAKRHVGMGLIAGFKLVKGVLLFCAALGLLHLGGKDVGATVEHWVTALRMDPDNRHIHAFLATIADVDPRKLRAISAGSFIYSALLLTEGVGLWLEKGWAEYLTVIATAGFVPLEIIEIIKRVRTVKILVLILNLVIVAYVIWMIRAGRKRHNSAP